MMWRFNEFKDSTAAIDDRKNTISYGELDDLSKCFSIHAKRKLVFHISQNSIGSMAGYAAMIQSETVPAMISHDIDSELLQNMLQVYQPQFLWVPEEKKSSFQYKREVFQAYGYLLLQTDYDNQDPLYPDLALLLTTSGSTGSPKLVRQSYENIRANTESIVEYLALDETERPITTLPMNYTYGLSIINSHLYVGATILITDKALMQKEFWQLFKEEGATSFGGVPYTYEMLKKLRIFRMDLPSLRTMTQAGGKLPIELHKEFAEYAEASGRKFVVMYGQTEATARMAYLPAEKSLQKAGSMGIAIPGGRFTLIDIEGQEITEPEVVGELVYQGKNVTLGYAERRKDLEKGDERHGTLLTGDMAKKDIDGYYYIVGRKKRFLKMYGKRVNLDEIEQLVKGRFPGIDCATSGVDDHMYIFVNDGTVTSDVRAYIAEITRINLSAIRVQYLEEIPKNDSGKTLYIKLGSYFEA